MDDKEFKKWVKKDASEHPEKYYPVNVLKELGYNRHKCKKCGRFFWSIEDRDVCGDSSCIGGFDFFNNSPAKNKMGFVELWQRFSEFFRKRGYTPIARYPVVARWNPSTEFVIASIVDFQPYVVNGSIKPVANPLVVDQPCLRFNDVDNVGLTGSHFTNFFMIGQHAFFPPKDYDQEKYFRDIHAWLTEGMGIPANEIIYHEDSWAGGGNGGASLEFFSRGMELGNQVYTMYDTSNMTLLPLKVLDMGAGHERMTWFTQGSLTAYDAVFPEVISYLENVFGRKIDREFQKHFFHYAPLLNVDENDVSTVWKFLEEKFGNVKSKVDYFKAVYSVAEHTRSLLIAVSDGMLPSNVGGGYNLRLIFRRAYRFFRRYCSSDDAFLKLFDMHAKILKPLMPDLDSEEVKKVMKSEINKYFANMEKHKKVLSSLKNVTTEKLIELYDSYGISPDEVKEVLPVTIPENFYKLVAEKHESKIEYSTKKEFDFKIPDLETEILYFDDYKRVKAKSKIDFVKFHDGKTYIGLAESVFYPTSGGQMHDKGEIVIENKTYPVLDVVKNRKLILLVVGGKIDCEVGQEVIQHVDFDYRKQLTIHHTSVHLLNGAIRHILGNHIWQHSAAKSYDKARLDVTHYELPDEDTIKRIESLVKQKIKQGLEVKKFIVPREVAEERFGFRIYQGGAVPGLKLRIVEIVDSNTDFDVEACGGTHLDNTSEIGDFMITNVSKVNDGVVRFEFVAGNAAKRFKEKYVKLAEGIKKELNLFDFKLDADYYKSIKDASVKLGVATDKLLETLKRFYQDISKAESMGFEFDNSIHFSNLIHIFDIWKDAKKFIDKNKSKLVDQIMEKIHEGFNHIDADKDTIIAVCKKLNGSTYFVCNDDYFGFIGPEDIFEKLVKQGLVKGGGKDIKFGKIIDLDSVKQFFD